MSKLNPGFWLVVSLLCWASARLPAQVLHDDAPLKTQYEEALVCMDAYHNKQAIELLERIAEQLHDRAELSTPFGMEVRSLLVQALEKDNRDEEAIEQSWALVDDSETHERWEVFVHTHLTLARLHEKHLRPEYCLQSLRAAQRAVTTQDVQPAYPRFAIRMASYHRIFSQQRDSAMFYAREVIRTAPRHEEYEHQGVGYMLVGLLSREDDFEMAETHFSKAAGVFRNYGNHHGLGFMYGNLAKLNNKFGHPQRALLYCDSFLQSTRLAITNGHDSLEVLPAAWEIRADVLEQMGQHDSAMYYLRLAHEGEMEFLSRENRDKVLEIEARYHDEQKARTIADQARALNYERTQRNWGMGAALAFFLFTLLLIYLYWQLNAAHRRMQQQAVMISQANQGLSQSLEQQIMLQGEIHHRVKNNLQVIISLLDLQQDEIHDPKALQSLQSMSNRIYSMAAVHEILYCKEGVETISLLEYTQTLCRHFRQIAPPDQEIFFDLNMEAGELGLETLMPLGIMMNELLTNSLKYATLPGVPLKIEIGLKRCADGFCLFYRDNGPGFPEGALGEREGGLGSHLLQSMCRQLSGQIRSRNDNGAVCEIFFREKSRRGFNASPAHASPPAIHN